LSIVGQSINENSTTVARYTKALTVERLLKHKSFQLMYGVFWLYCFVSSVAVEWFAVKTAMTTIWSIGQNRV